MSTNGHNGHNGKPIALQVIHGNAQPASIEIPKTYPGAELAGPPGLVSCKLCGVRARPAENGTHLSIHFPSPTSIKPCRGSWPPKPPTARVDLAPVANCVHGVPWNDCGACGTKKIPSP